MKSLDCKASTLNFFVLNQGITCLWKSSVQINGAKIDHSRDSLASFANNFLHVRDEEFNPFIFNIISGYGRSHSCCRVNWVLFWITVLQCLCSLLIKDAYFIVMLFPKPQKDGIFTWLKCKPFRVWTDGSTSLMTWVWSWGPTQWGAEKSLPHAVFCSWHVSLSNKCNKK